MDDELQRDVDQTINQLIQTAGLIQKAKSTHGFDHEIHALEKTQESLLARLINRQSFLEIDTRETTLKTIRKEELERKTVEYAKKLNQKVARSRRARSKS